MKSSGNSNAVINVPTCCEHMQRIWC